MDLKIALWAVLLVAVTCARMTDLDPRNLLKAVPIVAFYLLLYAVAIWMLCVGLKWAWKGKARRTPQSELVTGMEAIVAGVLRVILAVVLLVMLDIRIGGISPVNYGRRIAPRLNRVTTTNYL